MQANYDVNGNVIIGDRTERYKDRNSRKSKISPYQAFDGGLISAHPNVAYYEAEYRDFIEDYNKTKKDGSGFVHKEIFWDHVVVTKTGEIVLFESDDPSHESLMFCIMHHYVRSVAEFRYKQHKDSLKDAWAKRNGVKLIRISYKLTLEQKKALINQALS